MPSIRGIKKDKISQGYLSNKRNPLRIRQKGKKFELTKKFDIASYDESVKEEINVLVSKEEFKKLWPLTVKSLEKIRYYFPLKNGLLAEMDVYQKELKGLVVVEVEFKSVEQMNSFVPPKWFDRDVTLEHWSGNAYLAGKNFKDIKKYL
jgi:CYTH domain-containing protein